MSFLKGAGSKYLIWASAAGSIFGGGVLLKEFLGGKKYEGKENLKGKIAIITGANTGIGKETALEFAKRGAKVYMACRNIEKCLIAREEIIYESHNKQVFCKQCDLASFESVRNFAKYINTLILSAENRLDLLINNAGVMRCPKSFTKDGIELQLGTNHMGHFLLTNLLLNLLKETSGSRIVNVSSVAHMRGHMNFEDLNSDKGYDAAQAYNQSKLAQILFTKELAQKLKDSTTTCSAVHPGLVNTEISRHLGIAKSYIAAVFAQPFIWLFLKTPRQGAQTVLYAALSPELEGVSGRYYSNQSISEPSAESQDDATSKRLWATSELWTGIS